METIYKSLMAVHVIAVISWMAGILYLFRLFIYHTEESESVVISRFEMMEERLFRIITVPAMAVSLVAGGFMVSLRVKLTSEPWFWGKLFFVLLLITLTIKAGSLRNTLAKGERPFTSKQLRILNEAPTLLMIIIVFLVILKPFT